MNEGIREIEKKFVVKGSLSLADTNRQVCTILSRFLDDETVSGKDEDTYWDHPNRLNSTVRLRIPSNGLLEITVKTVDRGTNEDREEINVQLYDRTANAKQLIEHLCGASIGTVIKTFHKNILTFSEVAVYQVEGSPRIFLEVESHNMPLVNAVVQMLVEDGMQLEQEHRSVFQMFVKEVPK